MRSLVGIAVCAVAPTLMACVFMAWWKAVLVGVLASAFVNLMAG